jgi:hypothetical protein
MTSYRYFNTNKFSLDQIVVSLSTSSITDQLQELKKSHPETNVIYRSIKYHKKFLKNSMFGIFKKIIPNANLENISILISKLFKTRYFGLIGCRLECIIKKKLGKNHIDIFCNVSLHDNIEENSVLIKDINSIVLPHSPTAGIIFHSNDSNALDKIYRRCFSKKPNFISIATVPIGDAILFEEHRKGNLYGRMKWNFIKKKPEFPIYYSKNGKLKGDHGIFIRIGENAEYRIMESAEYNGNIHRMFDNHYKSYKNMINYLIKTKNYHFVELILDYCINASDSGKDFSEFSMCTNVLTICLLKLDPMEIPNKIEMEYKVSKLRKITQGNQKKNPFKYKMLKKCGSNIIGAFIDSI